MSLNAITVYDEGFLPNNAFSRIHGLNFVGAGVTVEVPAINFIEDVGIATITVNFGDIPNDVNISGVLTAFSFFGDGSGLTGIVATGTGVEVQDDGSPVGTASTINFGDNLTVDFSDGVATIYATGGGGGGESYWVETSAGIHTLSNVGIGTTNPTSALTVKGNTSLETLSVSGVSTLTTLSVGGTTGSDGQYLRSTGNGLTWENFTSLRSVYNYSATESQTEFIAAGINTGFVDVYLNGIRLDDANYSIIGIGVSLNVGAFGGDEVTVIGFNTVNASAGGGIGGGISDVIISTSENPPESPVDGNLWYNSTLGRGFVYYDDGDSSQWVDFSPALSGLSTGGTEGDVSGPGSSTDNAVTRFDGTTGKLIQNSLVTIGDDGAIVAPQAGSIIPFYFDNQAAFPSASTYHGALAHSHADGGMFYAHGGGWIQLADASDISWIQTSAGINTLSNVGIGTTNPTSKLTVSGDANISGILTVGTASITLDGSSNTITVGSGVTIGGSTGIITATSFVGALTGTATSTTNIPNLTGDITSVNNVTAIATGAIVNADINANAAIADTKLATIATAGKVSNSATTATNANTASAIVTRDASGNFSAGTITATSFSGSGANLTNLPASSITWQISSSGSTDYVFSGPGIVSGNTNDPILYLYRGFTYVFVNNTGSSHPFAIRESAGGSDYTPGVTGSQTGTQTFVVPMNAPSTLYYQCTIHSGMGNVINIV
jgi:hypothetical protein